MNNERVPSLPLPNLHQAYSSGTSSPRVSSIGSASSYHAGSQSSFTSAASSNGPKTPSPSLPIISAIPASSNQPIGGYETYPAMNQSADMYYSQHMSAGQAAPPQTVTSGAMSYHHAQPPTLQPQHMAQYPQQQYGQPPYGYPNGLTSPQGAPPPGSNQMGGQNVLPLPGVATPGFSGFDTTGQVAPPGMKPRVTATLWEDEGSLCFQVEARGICVARREDNHMINGTKLLNVAGMTRGRRDGILKSEKVRHVVKIGPMHLKGVWIPFERALDFANKEKITELLYPLFVHNIGALLYHPTNQTRTNQVMAAAERRKQEQNQMRGAAQTGGPGLPSIQQHHHHMSLQGPQQPLPSHAQMGRPTLDRAHTFPTPPTSASSVMGGGMNASDNGFQWAQSQGMGGAQGTNPISIDTSLSNTRSMPATPASTPPGSTIQNMQSYQSGAQQYDNTRPMYNPSTQQSPYQTANPATQDRSVYGQADPYAKSDMGPPSARPTNTGAGQEQKANGIMHQDQNGQAVTQSAGEDEAEHEHDAEYTHDSGAYDASRASYNYSSASAVGNLSNEHQHLSPEMTGSPGHPPASGRATPRTAAAPQPYYSQQTGYNTPPRVTQQTSSNLYNVMSNDRGSAAGAGGNDVYQPQADMGSMSNGYATQMNGATGGIKRGRDDDDDLQRPLSGGGMDLKRRKTLMDSSVPATPYDAMSRAPPVMTQQPRRGR
ncbi:Cell pattern formation-associated protein STUA [Colletotrichum spinosum]|uniref:Cell pattern formation-associated protein STUA n=1 Tax=Colletotrichum spinosum TaxID=1347390 RepID=A0A4R8PNV8_9PEZI|nr:Cell pattern formation-associated protein STUA [Colletotrichum spinosum]